MEQAEVASATDLVLRLARLRERDLGRNEGERVVVIGVPVDTIEIGLGQLDREIRRARMSEESP